MLYIFCIEILITNVQFCVCMCPLSNSLHSKLPSVMDYLSKVISGIVYEFKNDINV